MSDTKGPLPGAFAGNSFPQKIFENLLTELQRIDSKAIGVFGILSLIVGFLVNFLDRIRSSSLLDLGSWNNLLYISAIIVFLNIYFIVKTIYPRVGKGRKEGMIYFKDIILNTNEEYVSRGIKLSDLEITKRQYSQAHAIANIVNKKYLYLQFSNILTILTLLWIVFVVLRF